MKYSLDQLRAMFDPTVAAPKNVRPVTQMFIRFHRGIQVFRELPKASRSKYTPHQGKAEMARRAAA